MVAIFFTRGTACRVGERSFHVVVGVYMMPQLLPVLLLLLMP